MSKSENRAEKPETNLQRSEQYDPDKYSAEFSLQNGQIVAYVLHVKSPKKITGSVAEEEIKQVKETLSHGFDHWFKYYFKRSDKK